jgi:hypothetical protein
MKHSVEVLRTSAIATLVMVVAIIGLLCICGDIESASADYPPPAYNKYYAATSDYDFNTLIVTVNNYCRSTTSNYRLVQIIPMTDAYGGVYYTAVLEKDIPIQ